ncbi:hypothetical protein OG898_20045 [Streptomyces sp. NBC_00193]|uniref:hypothetical protein n=1 Tax=unclassified Streptomyces TaxID=2593676 RepID=UPI0022505879|nr:MULTISPECIES: hypothetical protein [unclassified Streptomyces]MCX5125441.1 hypothetical protein [Streptomyces sp. NBC_00347]MCX5298747.1 hypothetical protein [Streptomyces sp. NBC_00193]
MLTWVVRSFTLLAWLAFMAAGVWALGLHRGALPPYTGVLVLGWIGVAALWGRALTLWALPPGTGRAAAELGDPTTVWLRQAAALLVLIVVTAALTMIGTASGQGTLRAVKEAGPAVTSGTVVEVVKVRKRYERKTPRGYQSTLLLQTPDGTRIIAREVNTPAEPGPGKTYPVLWAPSAPALGGVADPTGNVSKFLNDRWGWTATSWGWLGGAAVIYLALALTFAVIAGAAVLHRLAWRPLPQTVQVVVVTVVFAVLHPVLTGAVEWNLAASPIGGLALLVTAVAMPIVAWKRSIDEL